MFQVCSRRVQPIVEPSFIWLVYYLMYYIHAKLQLAQNIIYSLYIFTALKPRHLIICKPCTNSSISIDSLCDTLICIIHAKIASCSHELQCTSTTLDTTLGLPLLHWPQTKISEFVSIGHLYHILQCLNIFFHDLLWCNSDAVDMQHCIQIGTQNHHFRHLWELG